MSHSIVYCQASPRAPKRALGTFDTAHELHDVLVQERKMSAIAEARAEGRPPPIITVEAVMHPDEVKARAEALVKDSAPAKEKGKGGTV